METNPTQPVITPIGVTGSNSSSLNGPLPDELKGWSWAAFLMSWIWGVSHGVWISFLAFVPLVNIVMPFVLGIKGNEWAWEHRKFASIQEFKDVQKAWTIAGVIILLVTLVLAGVFVFLAASTHQ